MQILNQYAISKYAVDQRTQTTIPDSNFRINISVVPEKGFNLSSTKTHSLSKYRERKWNKVPWNIKSVTL